MSVFMALAAVPGPAWSQAKSAEDRVGFQRFVDPAGRFSIEHPSKNWLVMSGGGAVVILADTSGQAVVEVEHVRLRLSLTLEDVVQAFTEVEADTVKRRVPDATAVEARLVEQDDRPVTIVEYRRRGPRGTQFVRQYSYPAGDALYRVICAAPVSQFVRYESVLARIARSLKPMTAESAGSGSGPGSGAWRQP